MPLLLGGIATAVWGDPVEPGGWRVPLGPALVVFFLVWNGWSLRLFSRHETGLLPGDATTSMLASSFWEPYDDYRAKVRRWL